MLSLPEKQIYILAISFMAAIFVAALVRLWLVRREEERLVKNKDVLEKQIVLQQKDLMTVRQESNAWRTEMQRQFDLFRHMASDQLGVEEKRFNDLLAQSTRREYELQTALALAKDMCIELPSAKARILHLESLLGNPRPPSDNDGGLPVTNSPVCPLPDLGGGSPDAPFEEPETEALTFTDAPPPEIEKQADIPPAPDVTPEEPAQAEDRLSELEQKLNDAVKKNSFLQQALTTARLRSRPHFSKTVRKTRAKQRA
ncbi:hypothetical protein [Prosthecobacter dejongeii]|uniref:Uncharacterized protein n=1 Tax=Prosthecobacter dejongeii TaxID=48465 RepID=A0A7W7YPQ8_9BACT|nr:hypothetical protein [Prosthecobacter dejongeii]MBB5040103.1 hypothetical protein [Prosthecobacter dejongeii]